MNVVSQVCDEDLYHYGYNGQMKVNEWAGLGNHYTAEFWEYDTREARRKNTDPFCAPMESPYAVNRNNPIINKDPNGDCPNCTAAGIGAIVGAVIGGGIELGSQLYHNGSVTDWKAVGGSAVQGAFTGAAAGFSGGASLFTTVAVSGVTNGIGGAINNTIQGKQVTVVSVATDITVGVVFGVGGIYLSGKIGQGVRIALPTIDEIFSTSISTRGMAEKFAQSTKYKGFQNGNEVLRANNLTFDLFDKAGNVVDVTTTDAKKNKCVTIYEKIGCIRET